jgi:hypothetical protein
MDYENENEAAQEAADYLRGDPYGPNPDGNRITEIGDADLPEHLRSDRVYSDLCHGEPLGLVDQFKAYCAEHRILYYARPRESFFVSEAYEMARLAGCDKVLLEDMS